MTDNPDKVAALEKSGLKSVERVDVDIPPHDAGRSSLDTGLPGTGLNGGAVAFMRTALISAPTRVSACRLSAYQPQ